MGQRESTRAVLEKYKPLILNNPRPVEEKPSMQIITIENRDLDIRFPSTDGTEHRIQLPVKLLIETLEEMCGNNHFPEGCKEWANQ